MTKRFSLICCIYWIASIAQAQVSNERYFTLDDLYALVLENHPVASQANLLRDEAKQQLRMARGNFDPKVEMAYERKQFNDRVYWNDWAFAFKVPLISNTDLKFTHYTAEGVYINPRETLPNNGLSGIGIEVPIGRGLFIDERRAVLRQAILFKDMNEAERIAILNDLLLNAALDYFAWAYVVNRQQILEKAVNLAEIRYRLVRQNVVEGAEAAIDSTEAAITVQARRIEARKGRLDVETLGLKLSTYLWSPDGQPLVWNTQVLPPPFDLNPQVNPVNINNLLEMAIENHPELQMLRIKQEILNYDFRLARENLKPQLNLNYEYIFPGRGIIDGVSEWNWGESYKVSAGVSIPIFLRKERGKFELTKIKLTTNQLKLNEKEVKIRVDLENQANYLETYFDLSNTYRELVANSQRLLDVENLKFLNGESTLFLVNQREVSLISQLEKQLDVVVTLEMNKIKLLWAAGIPYLGREN
jgi:outer membrane protein TolC